MVRNCSGGEMLKYWKQEQIPSEDFVIERVGSEAKNIISQIRETRSYIRVNDSQNNDDQSKLDPMAIGKFRLSGEIHQWMYDRYSLGTLLKSTGFKNIQVCKADKSAIPNFNQYLLDIEPDGSVRKPDSLFMEAIKL